MGDRFFLVVAVSTFALGVTLFLVSISSTSWQGLEDAVSISLWKVCFQMHIAKTWACNSWHEIPACMIAMAVVVMGMKGRDYLLSMKEDPDKIYRYFLNGIKINGYYQIGWALILAIVASLVNYISFAFFLLEYKDMTDEPRPTKV
ncbi:hypothetical protein MAR_037679 [Mya arenaria]|uniref:Uncharacterized protein n=1 Tax=Mya arenaria TaxID=6604 RepID=A0ABY7FP41_MYAAR|nr:hypothetical protein MAR_037679 [Mya arenaria]